MADQKKYTGLLAPIENWLSAVTEKDLIKGAGIVVVTGLFAAGAAYSSAARIQIPSTASAVVSTGMISGIAAIGAFVVTLLGWVFSTVIYHVGAYALGGKGALNRMFALAGYASIPAMAQELLRLINYSILGQATTPTIGGVIDTILNYFNVFSIIGLVLVGVAVMINYGISWKRAAIVALLPTIIGIAFALATRQILGGRMAANATSGGLSFNMRRSG